MIHIKEHFERAAASFIVEADALDQCDPLVGMGSAGRGGYKAQCSRISVASPGAG